jgi:hypothetical protein
MSDSGSGSDCERATKNEPDLVIFGKIKLMHCYRSFICHHLPLSLSLSLAFGLGQGCGFMVK